MSRYTYPALVAVCAFLTCLAMPSGQPIAWSEEWLPAGFFFGAMWVFGALWMWDGRWGG